MEHIVISSEINRGSQTQGLSPTPTLSRVTEHNITYLRTSSCFPFKLLKQCSHRNITFIYLCVHYQIREVDHDQCALALHAASNPYYRSAFSSLSPALPERFLHIQNPEHRTGWEVSYEKRKYKIMFTSTSKYFDQPANLQRIIWH